MMLPATSTTILALSALFAGSVQATAEAFCGGPVHFTNFNEFTITARNIPQGSIGSICGSLDSELRRTINNDGGKVRYLNNFCSTDNGAKTMIARIQLDKQSPQYQARLINIAVPSAFGSAGVIYNVRCPT